MLAFGRTLIYVVEVEVEDHADVSAAYWATASLLLLKLCDAGCATDVVEDLPQQKFLFSSALSALVQDIQPH